MVNNLQGELLLMTSMGIKPNYTQLAEQYDMDWRTVKKYHQGYQGKPINRNKPSKLDQYSVEIVDKLTIRRITVWGVYEFMVVKYSIAAIGTYSNFITYVKKNNLLPKKKNVGHPRYETAIGYQGKVDWKEDITLISSIGERFVINIFHLVLSFSRYSHLEISIQKRSDDVHRCLVNCFLAFGGVPKELLFDNMSTVANIQKGKKTVTNAMSSFAKDLGFKVRLCGTRKPETKGSVEAKNKVIDWIRAYSGEFETMEDLLEIMKEINFKMNTTVNGETGMSPTALFYKEKEYLQQLPRASLIDTYLSPNKYIVSNEALIRFSNSRYSVDSKFIGEEVSVDVLSNNLYIYYKGKLITMHALNENPINYHKQHYYTLMKGKAKEEDIDSIANENLKLMDKLLENRKVYVTNIEATKSPEALIAYINESAYGNWIISHYAHMSPKERTTFITGLNSVLPHVGNKDALMSQLKFFLKADGCKNLDYDCCINDFMAVSEADAILTEEGYNLIEEKYEKELQEFIETQSTNE